MTTTAPTIRIRDTADHTRKTSDRKPPQQATTAEVQRVHRRLAALENEHAAALEALQASITQAMADQRQLIEDLPEHAVRLDVTRLVTNPEKYDGDILPADFYSRVRAEVKYYEPHSHPSYDYEDQPALARISWLAGGELRCLNPTEVKLLRKAGHVIHENDREKTYDRQSPYYALWLAKEPTNLWLTLRQDDLVGLSWSCCMANHIRDVRNQDKVKWQAVTRASETYMELAPEEKNDTEAMLRESQTLFMMDSRIKGTLPWEIRTDSSVQAALARLRVEGRKTIQQGTEYETEVKAERPRLAIEAAARIAVVS